MYASESKSCAMIYSTLKTKLLTSTCTFTFQNLSSQYVVGVRLFYLTPVKNTVGIMIILVASHITIQPLTPVVNL